VTEIDLIDRAVLDGLLHSLGGDTEFLGELLQTYFDDAPQLLAQMRDALAAGKSEELRRAAHSLKSNSANFGAMSLSRMCRELEDMGKAGVLDGADQRIAQAEAEYTRVKAALEGASVL
jgi:HPt (histidine-containing phosphotransfer) domain-containing protein